MGLGKIVWVWPGWHTACAPEIHEGVFQPYDPPSAIEKQIHAKINNEFAVQVPPGSAAQ